ncbi:hypothetical protein ACE38W_03930 [Chitinophaga sp. Hz27]|uniref:DUF7683 domain-containing protein n=1 Tax=Chitinophaga sp. Hz27 TaxID=3347169 RepID=UPI0035D6C238
MELKRQIICFSLETEELIFCQNIDQIALANLKDIFHPEEDDPFMYYVYGIGVTEARMLNEEWGIEIEFDFQKFSYELHCSTT